MKPAKTTHGGARPKAGRKPLDPALPTLPISVRVTLDQKDKLQRLGGGKWVRKRIDMARDPGPDE